MPDQGKRVNENGYANEGRRGEAGEVKLAAKEIARACKTSITAFVAIVVLLTPLTDRMQFKYIGYGPV